MESGHIAAPYALLAELTYRCPLHCLYCSNPVSLSATDAELPTVEWLRIIDEAAALGVVQVHFSGGEPLARRDLDALVAAARKAGLYSNLITSGVGLDLARAGALAAAGLDAVQLSLQAAEPVVSARIAGCDVFSQKRQAAEAVLSAGLPLSMNVVVHSWNIDAMAEIVDLCVEWGADRIELANAQYYGWALLNRRALLPMREKVLAAQRVVEQKREQYRGIELLWILPDYYEEFPKPCMGGWGALQLTVTADGSVLPCPAAGQIATLDFESVRSQTLSWIWYQSPSFNAFRGYDWMREPCRSCDRREVDFGGCRCQAYALTGDAAATDPVCQWAPARNVIDNALDEVAARCESGDGPAMPGAPCEAVAAVDAQLVDTRVRRTVVETDPASGAREDVRYRFFTR